VPRQTLKQATLSGVRWLMLTRAISETLTLGATVVLARLISPAEFGRAAVALVFVPLASILTFEGFASALVQRETIDDDQQRSATFVSLVGGALLSGIVLALYPLWRTVFGAGTAGLIALVSPVFLLAALGAVSRALLWRGLDFRRMSVIDLICMTVGNVVALVLAIAGLNGRAIVLGGLAQTAATSLLLLIAIRPKLPRWHWKSQREISGFGMSAAFAGLVDTLFRNVDYAIIAAQLPAAQTGIYWRSFNLGVVYQDKLSGVMMQLAFPVYSRTESREELRALHQRATRVHAAVIFPLLASLIVLAPVLIPFVFGPAWAPSVRPAQILAVAGMIAAILTGYPQMMLAVGKPQALLRFNLGMLALYATVIALTVNHGLIVVSVAVAVAYFLILLGVYRFLLQRHVGISITRLIPELGPAVGACLALGAVTEPLRLLLAPILPAFLQITIVGSVGIVVYALALRLVSRAAWEDLALLIVRVLPPLGRIGRAGRGTAATVVSAPATAAGSLD
jgi:lipopolysaccharide exporter